MSDRLQKLLGMLEKQPRDTFLLYGAAQEYKKQGDWAKALQYLENVLAVDSSHAYAYYQKGQVLESLGNMEEAKGAYQRGIAAAKSAGDLHAASELAGALSMIE